MPLARWIRQSSGHQPAIFIQLTTCQFPVFAVHPEHALLLSIAVRSHGLNLPIFVVSPPNVQQHRRLIVFLEQFTIFILEHVVEVAFSIVKLEDAVPHTMPPRTFFDLDPVGLIPPFHPNPMALPLAVKPVELLERSQKSIAKIQESNQPTVA